MKKGLSFLAAVLMVCAFGAFALGSGESDTKNDNQGSDKASSQTVADTNLGDYQLEIKSCRLAKDYQGKKVVIVKYGFTNNGDKATSFMVAFEDAAYQNGVGLNEAYMLDDSAKYSMDNQRKEIKTGASLDVEVAYTLNDDKSDVEVEVKKLFSLDECSVSKTFSIA